ncbi:BT_3987 domain-containing protein [Capnocytophaga canimorsus]|uniref:BT_3987 domain-containing protein n=1 Tax=Capnocytophaga canimorsus TaxID=28188 RepID=UPI0037D7B770
MKIKYLLWFAFVAVAFVACDTPNYGELVPSNYNTVLLLKQTGEQEVTLYDTGEDGSYDVTIFKSGKLEQSTANASVRVLDEAELAEYSARVGKTYTGLPEDMYQVAQKDFDFGNTDRYKKANVVFKTDLIRDFIKTNTDKNYVLPILLYQKVKKDSVNAEKKLVLLTPKIVKPVIEYSQGSATVNLTNDNLATYNFTLNLPFVSPWDFECEIALPEKGVFSSDQVFFENGNKAVFKKGRSISEPVQIKVAKVGEFVGKKGVVPVTIVSSTKSGIQLPQTPFDLEIVYGGEHSKVNLVLDMLSSNFPQTQGPYWDDTRGVVALIDNDPATFYHSRYSPDAGDAPHHIKVNLKKAVNKVAFSYQNRNNTNGKPQDIKILVSNNGLDGWRELTRISTGLPVAEASKYDSFTFVSEESFSYLLIEVHKTNGGTAPTFFNMAELAIYAK